MVKLSLTGTETLFIQIKWNHHRIHWTNQIFKEFNNKFPSFITSRISPARCEFLRNITISKYLLAYHFLTGQLQIQNRTYWSVCTVHCTMHMVSWVFSSQVLCSICTLCNRNTHFSPFSSSSSFPATAFLFAIESTARVQTSHFKFERWCYSMSMFG